MDLWTTLIQTHSKEAIISFVIYSIVNLIRVYFAYIYLLLFDSFAAKDHNGTLLYGGLICIGWIVNSILSDNGYNYVQVLVLKMKATLFNTLYRHILRLQPTAFRSDFEGQVINAITEFHNLLDDNGVYFIRAVSSLFAIIGITIIFAWRLGWFGLLGIFCCVFFEVIHYYYAICNSRFLTKVA